MTVRISATDWCEGGLGIDDTVEIARAFAEHGAAGLDVSTGQVVSEETPAFGRSYQTPFADRIRNEIGRKYGVAVIAVGAISSYDDVNSLILAGRADLCALGRTHLYDPQWTLHAAAEQGYAGPGAAWPLPFAAGSRRPQAGRTDGPRPRLDLIRAGTPRTAHARWRPSLLRPGGPVTAFALTEEQQAFAAAGPRDRRRSAAAARLGGLARACEPRADQDDGRLGLLSRLFPGVHAGESLSREAAATDLCILRESLATQSTEAETALALQGLGSYPVLQSGREEIVRRWLPAVAAGDAVAAFALTEPEAGSDAAALTLRAEPDGQGLAADRREGLDLQRAGGRLLHRLRPDHRRRRRARRERVRGAGRPARPEWRAPRHDQPAPDRPPDLRRGPGAGVPNSSASQDRGFRVAMRTLDLFRPSVGAFAVGMAQAATDAAVAHAGTRTAFGGPLKDQQAVSHLLAEMATRTEAARLLVYAAAAAYDAGRGSGEIAGRSAMAKLFATETAQFVVDAAVQIHGARALRRGHLLEHLYREVRAPRIYEGASEIQRTIIARELYR